MSTTTGKCFECSSPTHPILVLETGAMERHQVLEYAASDSKAGWLIGRYPTNGVLSAELCEGCGRVTFRALPKETS